MNFNHWFDLYIFENWLATWIRVITKLPNSEQSCKGKVKTHQYINRQNAFFTFHLFVVYIPKCKQQLRTMKYYTQIRDIAQLEYLCCMFTTLRERYNNKQPRCDITWLMLQIIYKNHGFPNIVVKYYFNNRFN